MKKLVIRSETSKCVAHTLTRAHEEASHSEAAQKTLREPNKAIVALTEISLAIHCTQNVRSNREKYSSNDEQLPDMASIQEATHWSRQEEYD